MADEESIVEQLEQAMYGSKADAEASLPDEPVAEEEVEEVEEEGAKSLDEIEPAEDETLGAILGLSDDQLEIDEAGKVFVKASIDGEEKQVAVQDLLAAFQGTEFAAKKAEEVVAQKQQLEQEITEAQQAAQEKLGQMKKVSDLMEKELLADYNQHDWALLSQQNPGEYHRLREMYSIKAKRIKGLQESLSEEEKQQQEEGAKQQQQMYQKHLQVEGEKLLAAKKAEEVVAQKQQLEQEITEAQQAAQEKLGQMKKVSDLMEKELLADYNQHDWALLSQQNPGEYHRLREMYSIKAKRIKGLQESLSEEEKQQQEEGAKQQQQMYQKHLQVEGEKLLAANPTWQNPQVREKEMTELRSFLKTQYEYSDQEINQIADSRLIKLIQDAYSRKAPAKTVEDKKVIPKFQTPSAGRVKAAATARAAKAKRAALRRSGSQDALTQVLVDRM